MTLTVRLDAALESALVRYCTEQGKSKSLVVQESLATYLLDDRQSSAGTPSESSRGPSAPVSANHRAFADAGFIGAAALGSGPADKMAVRARATQKLRRSAP